MGTRLVMNLQFTLHINTIFSERNVTKIKQFALFVAKNGESCYVPTGLLFQKYIINYFF